MSDDSSQNRTDAFMDILRERQTHSDRTNKSNIKKAGKTDTKREKRQSLMKSITSTSSASGPGTLSSGPPKSPNRIRPKF